MMAVLRRPTPRWRQEERDKETYTPEQQQLTGSQLAVLLIVLAFLAILAGVTAALAVS